MFVKLLHGRVTAMSDDEEAERILGPLRDRRDQDEEAARASRAALTEAVITCLRNGLAPASIARGAGLSRRAVYDIRQADQASGQT